MKSLLLVIDVQKDFITEETKHIPEKISKLINENVYDDVVLTRYINSPTNICYVKLGFEGCLSEEGKQLALDSKNYSVIDKPMYTSLTKELEDYIKNNDINKIYLCGIDTECCVLKTALDLFENGYDVYVLKDYCAAVAGKEAHDNAIELLKRNIGENNIF